MNRLGFSTKEENEPKRNSRRTFLKSLPALVAVPAVIKSVAEDTNLTNIQKATAVDCNFDSPFLYVEAREDIKQGDKVKFLDQTKENPYRVGIYKNSLGYSKPCGLACADVKKGQWFFIQTVGHCKLPADPNNYFKSF